MDCKQRQFWLWLSMVLTISSSPNSLQAQSPPVQVPSPPEVQPFPTPIPSPEIPQPLPPPAELLVPTLPSPIETSPGVPQTIKVERFEVVGSTVFTAAQLQQVLAEFTNRPISFAELFNARSAITQLYFDNGYITSGAYIPPQTLQGKVVTIAVLEGGLESIQVSGTKYLNSNYIRRRLAIATNAPINRDRLLQALQLLQLNPLINNISAELTAGTRPGQSILEVQVSEAQSTTVQATLDNSRVPSVGSLRRRLQLNEGNLLGIGDTISFAYTNTEGSNAIDTSYALPLNARNGTLNFGYGTSSSNIIEPPFDLLDIKSESRYYDITLRQPIVQTPSQEFILGISASRLESETSLLGFPLPLSTSAGADEQGRTRISALRFFQEWTGRDTKQVIAARSQFNLGIGAFDATINAVEPDSRFFSWQGQAQWVRLLAPQTLVLVRGNIQLATTSVVPLEQFSLGGTQSVRGYRQDLILSDSGAFASAEVRLPILRLGRSEGVLQVAPFIDVGTTWNVKTPRNPSSLASVGLGLIWQHDRFTARLDYGIPIISVSSTARTWQENGLYFSVFYNPF